MHIDTLIIGGGLSGLALARSLHREGRCFALYEARSRLGGRILSGPSDAPHRAADQYDLGPAWVWPHQPRVRRLLDELGLQIFEQHASGRLVLQDRDGSVRRDLDFATMAGAQRVAGGLGRLIEMLASELPSENIFTDHRVTALHHRSDAGGRVEVGGEFAGTRFNVTADAIVLAVPPRVVRQTIDFADDMDDERLAALASVPTWMAAHAKVIAIYERPFWREAGLSGDGISHMGPLAEIHDATPFSGEQAALFGFVGIPPGSAARSRERLIELSTEQLGAMFGAEAKNPQQVMVMDWATEPFTATAADLGQPAGHSPVTMPPVLTALWDGQLTLASSEMSSHNRGLVEGALDAAAMAGERLGLSG